MMRVQVEGVSPQRHGNPESSKGKFDRESSFNRHGLNRSYHLRRSSKPPRESTPIRRLAGGILMHCKTCSLMRSASVPTSSLCFSPCCRGGFTATDLLADAQFLNENIGKF